MIPPNLECWRSDQERLARCEARLVEQTYGIRPKQLHPTSPTLTRLTRRAGAKPRTRRRSREGLTGVKGDGRLGMLRTSETVDSTRLRVPWAPCEEITPA